MTVENAVDQAEPQSMEDRIAGQFGIPEDESQEAQENVQPEGQDEPESAEVEIE
jgi:hypothetical protein